MIDTNSRNYIMKIISGPMNGQELMISIDKNLIIIDSNISYHTDVDENGLTTYYIPSDGERCEFSIDSDPAQQDTLLIRFSQGRNNYILPVVFQEVLLADSFPIAVKPLNDRWNSLISQALNLNAPEIKTNPSNQSIVKQKSNFNKKIITILLILVIILLIIFSFQINPKNNDDKKYQTLENILNDSHHPISFAQDNKNKTLIIVSSQRDEDWSRKNLIKAKYNEKFTIINSYKLESEIEDTLIDIVPSLLKVEIKNPCNPIVRVIKNQKNININEDIDRVISKRFSCYTKSKIEYFNFDDLLKKAELGLTESNVQWNRITKGNKVIFVIRDSLNDKQTISLINFTNSFNKKWGNKQIQFSVSLANNELAGKSFITHVNGYTLLGKNHWLFNANKFNQ
ncbi:PrgH/EprH family type III secretion apparatus protein [Providencia rustigianii]|uniref:PrgH/EprH family type III secretion apparatus protein n=1 Tax=Providencia rustigianii TaxID=158850 RepID=UPI000D87DDA5|nr:type III secretion system needle complex protein PrgH [Providencia rustigianii]